MVAFTDLGIWGMPGENRTPQSHIKISPVRSPSARAIGRRLHLLGRLVVRFRLILVEGLYALNKYIG